MNPEFELISLSTIGFDYLTYASQKLKQSLHQAKASARTTGSWDGRLSNIEFDLFLGLIPKARDGENASHFKKIRMNASHRISPKKKLVLLQGLLIKSSKCK